MTDDNARTVPKLTVACKPMLYLAVVVPYFTTLRFGSAGPTTGVGDEGDEKVYSTSSLMSVKVSFPRCSSCFDTIGWTESCAFESSIDNDAVNDQGVSVSGNCTEHAPASVKAFE